MLIVKKLLETDKSNVRYAVKDAGKDADFSQPGLLFIFLALSSFVPVSILSS